MWLATMADRNVSQSNSIMLVAELKQDIAAKIINSTRSWLNKKFGLVHFFSGSVEDTTTFFLLEKLLSINFLYM